MENMEISVNSLRKIMKLNAVNILKSTNEHYQKLF